MDPTHHFGQWLRREIQGTGLSFPRFSDAYEISVVTLYKWTVRRAPVIRGYMMARLAKGLGIPREQIEAKLSEARAATGGEPANHEPAGAAA